MEKTQFDNDDVRHYFEALYDRSEDEVQSILNLELASNPVEVTFGINQKICYLPIVGAIIKSPKVGSDKVLEKCEKAMKKKDKEIATIVAQHKMTNRDWADCCYDIVQLVAPVAAQMLFGITGLAVVGAILIVCKKRFAIYFESSKAKQRIVESSN